MLIADGMCPVEASSEGSRTSVWGGKRVVSLEVRWGEEWEALVD